MGQSTKEQRDRDHEKGKEAEEKFIDYINQLGFMYKRANKYENRYEGWDLKVTWTPEGYIYKDTLMDIKGVKCNPEEGTHNWLELITSETEDNQKIGWALTLRGKADFVSFDCYTDWVIVRKSDLKNLIYKLYPFFKKMEEKTMREREGKGDYDFWFLNNIKMYEFNEINTISKREKTDYYEIYNRDGDLLLKIPEIDLRDMATDIWEQNEILQYYDAKH